MVQGAVPGSYETDVKYGLRYLSLYHFDGMLLHAEKKHLLYFKHLTEIKLVIGDELQIKDHFPRQGLNQALI